MPTCFVIQPFDGGPYDKRYKDVLVPAIEDAGLEAYRVDEDPSTTVLIEQIENKIREADVCLADITTNSPNIWYEVGFAFANNKPVVMICAEPRVEEFPFDVRHRAIIKYTLQSSSDFVALRKEITKRLKAQADQAEKLRTVEAMSQLETTEGLAPHEVAVLVMLMSDRSSPDSATMPHKLKDRMTKSGYTRVAAGLAMAGLERKEMITFFDDHDYDGNPYTACRITGKGIDWLLANQDRFRMREEEPARSSGGPLRDEDIPF